MSATTTSSFLQTNISSLLLKQLRATAALQSYDFVFQESCMKLEEQQRKTYQYFHGNVDLNIVSQVDLLLKGHGKYSSIYDKEYIMVREQINSTSITNNTQSTKKLFVKPIFCNPDDYQRYSPNRHFTVATIASPVKSKPDDKASGRYLYELAKNSIKNLKKACVIADEWLDEGNLPVGRSWDDLYAHVLAEHELLNPKEKIFIGFMAFMSMTKYREGGGDKNHLASLENLDIDGCKDEGGNGGHHRTPSSRKKARLQKDDCARLKDGVVSSMDSPFYSSSSRGGIGSLPIDIRLQVIEVAQFEDRRERDDYNTTIMQLNCRRDSLLKERSQAIDLAKIICPVYNKDDESWMTVTELSDDLKKVKQSVEVAENSRISTIKNTSSCTKILQAIGL